MDDCVSFPVELVETLGEVYGQRLPTAGAVRPEPLLARHRCGLDH